MKIAAATAIAELAVEQVPRSCSRHTGQQPSYGPDYIIPAPFDPRLMEVASAAVARGQRCDSGVAQKPIEDMDA